MSGKSMARSKVEEERGKLLKLVDNEGSYILDAGAGNGRREVLELRGAVLVNLDIIKCGGLAVVGDIESMPFADNTFAGVSCTQVLEHVANPLEACREMYRVLKSGGRILVTAPFVWIEHGPPVDYWRFTRAGLKHILEQAGFIDIELASNSGYFRALNYVLKQFGTIVLGRYSGRMFGMAYYAVDIAFRYLDRWFNYPEFAINNCIYGLKGRGVP